MTTVKPREICSKVYHGIPFAHRAPFHDGHCRWVHGHNWSIKFEFKGKADENQFIIDFGKLGTLQEAVGELDHALVISEQDPELTLFQHLADRDLCNLVVIPSTSCEGLAKHFFELANDVVKGETDGRVRCSKCIVTETDNNSASYAAP